LPHCQIAFVLLLFSGRHENTKMQNLTKRGGQVFCRFHFAEFCFLSVLLCQKDTVFCELCAVFVRFAVKIRENRLDKALSCQRLLPGIGEKKKNQQRKELVKRIIGGECPGGFLCFAAMRNSVLFSGQSKTGKSDENLREDSVFLKNWEEGESVRTAAAFLIRQKSIC